MKRKPKTTVINYRHEQKRVADYFAAIHEAIIEADEAAGTHRDLVYEFADFIGNLRVAIEEIVGMAESGELECECLPIVVKLFDKLGSIKPAPGVF